MIDVEELADRLTSWVGAGIIDADQAQKILALEYPDNTPEIPRPTHTELTALFADLRKLMREQPSLVVENADDPMWLVLGWSAYYLDGEEEKRELFTIGLRDAKRGHATLPQDLRAELSKISGRRRIMQWLNRLPEEPEHRKP